MATVFVDGWKINGVNTGDWFGDLVGADNTTLGGLKRTTEGFFFSGQLAEVMSFDALRTSGEVTQLEDYIDTRYGTSIP